MQVFFNLSRVGIDSASWSKTKFDEIVTAYLKSLPGVQFMDMLHAGTGWDAYKCLIPVPDKTAALALRKEVEALCRQVGSGCRPYYFRFRETDVIDIHRLSAIGLTTEESVKFAAKAPPGKLRFLKV
jgi:hypothetical protein